MSLTNEDLKSIKGIVDTAIDTKIDHAIDTKLKPIVNDAVEGVEKRLHHSITSEIRTEIRASEQRMTHAIMGHSDARHVPLSAQMENGFTHLQNQFRKSIRP